MRGRETFERIRRVATRLGPLRDRVVFVLTAPLFGATKLEAFACAVAAATSWRITILRTS